MLLVWRLHGYGRVGKLHGFMLLAAAFALVGSEAGGAVAPAFISTAVFDDGDRSRRRFRAVVEGYTPMCCFFSVHGNVGHAGHLPRRLLHARGVRRARHAGDIERLLQFLLAAALPRANGCFT